MHTFIKGKWEWLYQQSRLQSKKIYIRDKAIGRMHIELSIDLLKRYNKIKYVFRQ